MKECSDQFLESNPQNNTVEENWTNFKDTLIEVEKTERLIIHFNKLN
jgi:hypothetical protein